MHSYNLGHYEPICLLAGAQVSELTIENFESET